MKDSKRAVEHRDHERSCIKADTPHGVKPPPEGRQASAAVARLPFHWRSAALANYAEVQAQVAAIVATARQATGPEREKVEDALERADFPRLVHLLVREDE